MLEDMGKTLVRKTAVKKSSPQARGKHILVVEDERPMAKALELKLTSAGFMVTVAFDGGEALAHLAKSYDLILLDLVMPRVDGFTVLEERKRQNNTTPVIVLSNLSQDDDRARARALGAREYFVKADTPIAAIVARVKTELGV